MLPTSPSPAALQHVITSVQPHIRPLYRRKGVVVMCGLLLWSLLVWIMRRIFSGSALESSPSSRALTDRRRRSPSRHSTGLNKAQDGTRRKKSKRPSSRLPSMIVLLGIPGSGKTTWAREYKEKVKNSTVILSSDEIRLSLTGSLNDRSRESEVRERLLAEVKRNIEEHTTFIVDDCHNNLTAEFRAQLLELTKFSRLNPVVKKLSLRPSFADARIQRDIAEKKDRYIPTYAELESLYTQFKEAEASLPDEEWFMEKN